MTRNNLLPFLALYTSSCPGLNDTTGEKEYENKAKEKKKRGKKKGKGKGETRKNKLRNS